jgi:lysophospholipase
MLKRQGLPNSNYRRQDGFIQQRQARLALGQRANRREIPAGACESTWAAPDGHALRRIDWPGGNSERERGSLLFLPGRGDFYEKYLETLDHWAARGWRVTAIDWRGQAGSGRLGKDERTGHCEDFADWVMDLQAFWLIGRGSPWAKVLAGHSMGGHLALRAVVDAPPRPTRWSVGADARFLRTYSAALLHPLARLMARLGDPRRPAWKLSEKPGEKLAWRAALLTHDPERMPTSCGGAKPDPSWRWARAAGDGSSAPMPRCAASPPPACSRR